jgi:exopolysaccharide biosynthesis protein
MLSSKLLVLYLSGQINFLTIGTIPYRLNNILSLILNAQLQTQLLKKKKKVIITFDYKIYVKY